MIHDSLDQILGILFRNYDPWPDHGEVMIH